MNESTKPPKGQDTARRLLATGRELFARSGFEGTSIRALTRAAGTNLGAVTYHFQSKEGLYEAVLEDVFSPVRDGIQRLAEAPVPAPTRIELFVRVMFQHQREHQDLPLFMVQEIILGDVPSPPVLRTVRTVVSSLSRIMSDGQEEGTLVEGDPVLMALTLLSQPIYLSVMPRILVREDLAAAGLPQPDASAEEHVVAFVRRAFFRSTEEEQ